MRQERLVEGFRLLDVRQMGGFGDNREGRVGERGVYLLQRRGGVAGSSKPATRRVGAAIRPRRSVRSMSRIASQHPA